MMGLTLDYYWSITPKQFQKHANAFVKMEQKKMREKDILNHILGKYIGYAVNDPRKYPRKPFLDKEDKKEMTAEDMEKYVKRKTKILGGTIIK